MATFRIGLVLPLSSILPMAKCFERGVKEALANRNQIDLVTELIGSVSARNIREAIDKLFDYHEVDAIVGIFSIPLSSEVITQAEKYKKPILISNLGEHLPVFPVKSEYVFFHSLSLWQHVWALGYWAVRQFGLNGAIVTGFYDSGYSFPAMLNLGMQKANEKSELSFSIGTNSMVLSREEMKQMLRKLSLSKPDFIFATFCGQEASNFLSAFSQSELRDVPLLGLPFLLENFEEDQQKLSVFGPKLGQTIVPGEIFQQMGFESGQLMNLILDEMDGAGQWAAMPEWSTEVKQKDILLLKYEHDGNKLNIRTENLEEVESIPWKDEALQETMMQSHSSWFNNYLAV